MYRLSKRSKSRLDGINSTLMQIAIHGVVNSPYDYGITLTGGLRTSEDQNELYKKKVSKCDGYIKKSYHQTGNAFDIYAYVDGKASWDGKYYLAIANHLIKFAKENYNIKLRWGGHFLNKKQRQESTSVQNDLKKNGKGWDKPHFEIRK